jgi:hypothetical protein
MRMLSEAEAKPLVENEFQGMKVDHFFRVGETVELKGSKFRVKSISPKGLKLKLLPRNLGS